LYPQLVQTLSVVRMDLHHRGVLQYSAHPTTQVPLCNTTIFQSTISALLPLAKKINIALFSMGLVVVR